MQLAVHMLLAAWSPNGIEAQGGVLHLVRGAIALSDDLAVEANDVAVAKVAVHVVPTCCP
jgi:hypothetical protein